MTLKREKVIPGLPAAVAHDAIAAASKKSSSRQSRQLIGLHRTKSGIAVGFSQPVGDEISVEAIATVLSTAAASSAEDDLDSGIICRSIDNMRLYWLPAHKAALANLSGAQLEAIFKSGTVFRARLLELDSNQPSQLSILDLQKAKAQFQQLKIGREFNITLIEGSQFGQKGKRKYLAKLPTTGIVLECLTYSQTLKENEILAEVTQRFDGTRKLIEMVPLGRRRQAIDLPSCWLNKETSQSRATISRQMQWHREGKPVEFSQFEETELDDKAESLGRSRLIILDTERALHLAYYDAHERGSEMGDRYLTFQRMAAMAWFKENIVRPEMNLLSAMMAARVLSHVDESVLFRQLVENIALRARRSLHIEVLHERWLRTLSGQSASSSVLSKRLDEITIALLRDRSSNQKNESIEKIYRMYDAVKIRQSDSMEAADLIPVASGLSAALGKLPNITELAQETTVLINLLNLYHSLQTSVLATDTPLHESHDRRLLEMVQNVVSQDIDITLLDPISTKQQVLSLLKTVSLQSCVDAFDEDTKLSWLRKITADLSEYQQKIQKEVDNVTRKLVYLNNFLEDY